MRHTVLRSLALTLAIFSAVCIASIAPDRIEKMFRLPGKLGLPLTVVILVAIIVLVIVIIAIAQRSKAWQKNRKQPH